MTQATFSKNIDQAISLYNSDYKDNHTVYVVTTIAKRENISLQDALEIYEAICEKIGSKNTQNVYAILSIADTLNTVKE